MDGTVKATVYEEWPNHFCITVYVDGSEQTVDLLLAIGKQLEKE